MSYLKPLRRKVGIVVLLIACVFAVAWIRSSLVKDHLTSVDGLGSSMQAISFDGHFGFVIRTGFAKTAGPEIRLRQSPVESILEWAAERGGWCWYRLGFGMVNDEWEGGHLKGWFAYYGSFVVPLTLLSAYLLVSKPRPPQTKISKPATDGA